MRTTVDLSDEAYLLAKAVARDRRESLGKVMCELIIKGVQVPEGRVGEMRMVNGWPVVDLGRPITNEEVLEFLAKDE